MIRKKKVKDLVLPNDLPAEMELLSAVSFFSICSSIIIDLESPYAGIQDVVRDSFMAV